MEDSTAITVLTDSRGRALIAEPARLALAIEGLVSQVDLELRVLCLMDDERVHYPDNPASCSTSVYVDTQGRFSIPVEKRRELGIDGDRAILEVHLSVQEREPP